MTEQKGLIFRFGEFEVREGEFCLTRGEETIPVEPKAYRVLLHLLRNPHRLVTKDELLDAVWQETSVSENSLTRAVALLRRLLGDDTREPRYIATVPTVGYRLQCEVAVSGGETNEVPAPVATSTEQTQPEMGSPSGVTNRGRGARRSWARLAWIGAVFVAAIVSVALLRRFEFNKNLPNVAGSAAMRITTLTILPGLASGPALSPDGERLAFFWGHAGPNVPNLYVQLVGGSNPIQLTHDHRGYLCCANWSPDGQQIAFGRCDDSGGGVFVVPALGGSERKLTDVVCPRGDAGYPEWTRDGRSMILADRCTPGGARGIVRFSLETGDKICLHEPPSSDIGDIAPALSPDQETVAFITNTSTELNQIDTVPASGGSVRMLVPAVYKTGDFMWSPNGDRIIFDSNLTGSPRAWQISPAGGAMKPELEYPDLGSLSRDGRRIAYEGSAGLYGFSDTIWHAELSGAGRAILSQEIIPTSEGQNSGIQVSSDGRQIVYQSRQSGEPRTQIWKSNIDGSHSLPLTSFHTGYPGTPRWSPDDRLVVFDYHTSPHGQIYVVDAEGRNQRRITSGDYENVVPSWSRDGNSIYFASNRTGRWQVWKHSVASGQESQVTRNGGYAALESSDGKTLYYSKFEGGGLWSLSEGQEQHLTDAPHLGDWGQFSITNDGIYLIDSWTKAGHTLVYYDLRTRHTSPVLVLKESPKHWSSNLTSTRDGRIVLYVQEERHGSILMAEKTQ
jgi:Tol biopolymer transport system component/DNA-binding winged helix-turn-helix (wHTH) protein